MQPINSSVAVLNWMIGAYYALSTGEVAHNNAPTRITKGVANHLIPVVILTRFAVDVEHQGMGLGRAMLRDALFRVTGAAAEIGRYLSIPKTRMPRLSIRRAQNSKSHRPILCIYSCL